MRFFAMKFGSSTFRAPLASAALRDERGSVTIIFGLTIVALMLSMGLAVDMGLALNARTKLSQAIDVAVLSAAKSARENNLTKAETEAIAQLYVDSVVKSLSKEFSTMKSTEIKVSSDVSQIDIKLAAVYQTRFGGIIGIPTFDIDASGAGRIDGNDVEVGMQLDVTGSMGGTQGGVVKLTALKNSAKNAIDILIPDKKGPNKVRVGYAPFSDGVNAGGFAAAVSNGTSTKCTIERTNLADQATDNAPVGADALKKSNSCPPSPVVGLTDDKNALKAGIDALGASGPTAGHLGAAWSWYLLSPTWANIWGGEPAAPYNDGKTLKFSVMMTDGEYNTFGGANGNTALSEQYALQTCAGMKNKGITIYTIGFGDSIVGSAKTTLETCATDITKFFLALNQADLDAAFEAIARDITALRLTR